MVAATEAVVGQAITALVAPLAVVVARAITALEAALLSEEVASPVEALLLEVVASHLEVELADTINQVVQALLTVPLQVAHPLALPLDLVSTFKEE